MENTDQTPHNNENVEGYKVPGDGNVPNTSPPAGNQSFEENPHAVVHKNPDDIPGKEFNIGDKAYFDSSKKDFVKTVSNHNSIHSEKNLRNIDMHYKTPDGDR